MVHDNDTTPPRPPVAVKLTVKEVTETGDNPLEGVLVAELANADGKPTGQTATSDKDGIATLNVMPGVRFGVKLTKSGYMDSYTFGLSSTDTAHRANILPTAMATGIATLLAVTLDPAKAIVAGNVNWKEAQDVDVPVGCAAVEATPAGQIFYIDADGSPTTPDKLSSTSKSGAGFILMTTVPGTVTFKAKIDGNEVASGTNLVFAGSITFDTVMLASGAANPTPASCNQ